MTLSSRQPAQGANPTKLNHVWWWILGLTLPMAIVALRGARTFTDLGAPLDTTYTYLPLAKLLLESAAEFWRSQDLLRAPPGTSIYMALAGADLLTIKTANLALAFGVVVMMFDTGRRMAGPLAAAAGAWLYALSPLLFPWSFMPMMEPPFLFLVMLWLWSTTWCTLARPGHWSAAAGVVVAGLALAATTLTRATYMYWIPAAMLLAGAMVFRPLWAPSSTWRRLALIHLLALLCIGGYMARNAHEFGKPAIAVGAGAALYFGNNPLTDGQEPPYFGLSHDEGSITGPHSHLSIEGDARLVTAARLIIADTPLPTLAKMYLHKAGSLLFFSKSHLPNYGNRIWRILLLVLAVAGAWLGRRHPIILMLAGSTLYQWVVHIPALYSDRYSVDALDIPLTILAAAGAGLLFQQKNRLRAIGVTATIMLLCMLAGAWSQRYSAPNLPNLAAVPHQLVREALPGELQTKGFDADPFHALATTANGLFEVRWEGDLPHLDGASVLRLGIARLEGSCQRAWMRYVSQQGEVRSETVNLRELGSGQDFTRGMIAMGLAGPGRSMDIGFECKAGSRLQLSELGIYEASLGKRYREKTLKALHTAAP